MYFCKISDHKKIFDALYSLKHTLRNPLYEDVIIDENWNNDNSLWNAFISNGDDFIGEQEDDSMPESDCEASDKKEKNRHNDDDNEDERSKLSGIPFDSCIQPKDITADSNAIINFAPGENKKPKPFHDDDNAEELSFPTLFQIRKF